MNENWTSGSARIYFEPRAPTTTDDSTQNHDNGCFWRDTVSNNLYCCRSNTVDAAVWDLIFAQA